MINFNAYKPKEAKVFAYKCPECAALYYPAPMICKKCSTRRDPSGVLFSSWEKVSMEGKCKLLTWTKLYNLPAGFTDRYLMFGIVEFENGLRASGRLLVENTKTGMELNAHVGVVREGIEEDIYGFMFEA